jgi:3-polyprenyl-4-hydroxybenzoate decarboxylase
MTEIQTRLLAEAARRCCSRTSYGPTAGAPTMPVLVNLFGTVERVGLGHGPRAAVSCARSARRWPSCASPSRRAAGGRAGDAAAGCDRDGDAAEDGEKAPCQEIVLPATTST